MSIMIVIINTFCTNFREKKPCSDKKKLTTSVKETNNGTYMWANIVGVD